MIRHIATLSLVPLYAAYGSNMDPAQMMERAPHSPMAGTGWLVGWRLTFGGEDLGWEGALATIVEAPRHQVFNRHSGFVNALSVSRVTDWINLRGYTVTFW